MKTIQFEPVLSPAAMPEPANASAVTIITPPKGWQLLNLRELWKSRELLFFLTWREVAVRYKQTVLGAAWAILQPAMMMIVFTIFLGRLARIDSGDLPYPVFVYAGLLPWTFFSTAISNAGNSVVGSAQMVSKIYFPRLLIPLAAVGAAVVDFLIAFLLLIGLMFYYGIAFGWGILLVPLLLLLAALAAVGVGAMLAALNVAYRDFRYTIPFLVQIWMFATPTVYMNVDATPPNPAPQAQASRAALSSRQQQAEDHSSPSAKAGDGQDVGDRAGVPPAVKALLRLNPMTGLIAFFRAATLGGPLPWLKLGYSSLVIAGLLVIGIAYFRRVENTFADII